MARTMEELTAAGEEMAERFIAEQKALTQRWNAASADLNNEVQQSTLLTDAQKLVITTGLQNLVAQRVERMNMEIHQERVAEHQANCPDCSGVRLN